ncbi:uncharacterized mitochondrial protein AtMg00310-like [Vicia villosa]|uniref:uncharacterized mitochondrial protein AtMg00310-like n=1 Tax=Vicia villosa TaxID=3911 RepID=UPI00273C2A1C|nr:uncharacterized mitochondrial protein AtMg00310-like [Vicia villosa]
MKAILRGFEMVFVLKVNFHKSKLYGIGVGDWLMETTSNFLACDIEEIPFKFLGVKVQGNPRKSAMWGDVISHVKSKLEVWRGRRLSHVGRVVMINSVLNVIPTYTLSFYRVPKKVLQRLCQLQGNFLWNRKENSRAIHWASWKTVCKTKEQGGLGVKDIEVMNMALLNKWKWRILKESDKPWVNILNSRYDNIKVKVLEGDAFVLSSRYSIWWRDLINCELDLPTGFCKFAGIINCSVENGGDTALWQARWVCDQSLSEAFTEIHERVIDKNTSIASAGVWEGYE